jgi:hypothetical protein
MKWITREKVKVDWVACPWLIKRFIDPQAEFKRILERESIVYDALYAECQRRISESRRA